MRRFAPVTCVLLALWLAGCGGDSEGKRKTGISTEVGDPAPEIEGVDADGKVFRLSDYRGKVVLLDFWGSWCGPCMSLVPRERALVKVLEGKPFVLLGVNADKEQEDLRQAQQENQINWRSWWDGYSGPIARTWGVQSWPTMVLIDHEGIIRHRFTSADPRVQDALDEALVDLLKKVPAGKGDKEQGK